LVILSVDFALLSFANQDQPSFLLNNQEGSTMYKIMILNHLFLIMSTRAFSFCSQIK